MQRERTEKEQPKEKKLLLKNSEKKEKVQTKAETKPNTSFLKKKEVSCAPLCGLFKIKCSNCKPGLDCFNDRFEAFLKENDLWILNKTNKGEIEKNKIKRKILDELINCY